MDANKLGMSVKITIEKFNEGEETPFEVVENTPREEDIPAIVGLLLGGSNNAINK